MKNDLIFIIVLILIIGYVFLIYKVETMADMTNVEQIKDLIKQVYLADVESIRNLSEVASKLQSGGLTIPGNLTVTGEINIKDTNTKLLKGDGNSLRVKTNNGYVDIGSQNSEWCHIYTDRPKFAFNKPLTDVASVPYKDYTRTSDLDSLANKIQNNINVNKSDFDSFKSNFNGYEFKPVCMRNSSSGWKSWIDYGNSCDTIGIQNIKNGGWDQGGFTAVIPVKGKYS